MKVSYKMVRFKAKEYKDGQTEINKKVIGLKAKKLEREYLQSIMEI